MMSIQPLYYSYVVLMSMIPTAYSRILIVFMSTDPDHIMPEKHPFETHFGPFLHHEAATMTSMR